MEKALSGFEEVVSMEEEKGEWGFKAYKQMVKLHFKRGHYDAMMKAYQAMLTYIKSAVTRNYSEKVINKVLDLVSGTSEKKVVLEKPIDEGKRLELLQTFYEATLARCRRPRTTGCGSRPT